VLAYCIAEQQSKIDIPPAGVAGAPVRSIDVGALRCFVSEFAAQMPNEPVPEMVKAFSEVLQRIFAQTAIIPFRFPTVVESEAVLTQFVEHRRAEYSGALQRLRDKVQMDVRISAKSEGPENSMQSSQSGKNYLRQKRARYQQAQSVQEEFRRVSHSVAGEWTQRDTTTGVRGFALLDRASLPIFLEKIAQVHTPAGITARVTGPWPPSEFVEIVDE
jgi:hypothetical protein